MNFSDDRHLRWLTPLALTIFPLLCAAATMHFFPFGIPMPGYWEQALEIARSGHLAQRFNPAGYPQFAALGVLLGGSHAQLGVILLQAVLQVAITWMIFGTLRALAVEKAPALLAALAIQLHPELLLSVFKIWDISYSTALLMLIAMLALCVLHRGRHAWLLCILLGAATGVGIFERPNYLSLLPCILAALWFANRQRVADFSLRTAVMCAMLCLAYASLSHAAYGTLVFPGNGPYNLYAGSNSLSEAALKQYLNAEPSIVPSLLANGMTQAAADPQSLELQHYYVAQTVAFVRTHPLLELRLIAVKLFCFFRPDTKLHSIGTLFGDVELLLALAAPLWLLTLLLRRKLWQPQDTLLLWLAVLYLVPFLLTNSDPRFRYTLDILLITHMAALWLRLPQKNSGGTLAA